MALFFLILGYLLTLKIASSESLLVWWTAALLLLGVVIFKIRIDRWTITVLSMVLLLLPTLIFIYLLFHDGLTGSVDRFIGAFMIVAPAVGFLLPRRLLEAALPYVVLIFMLLSLWGLVQHLGGAAYVVEMGGRANSIFTTPNSFAAALNLVNIVLITLYLAGRLPRYGLAIILLLFAGLLATESRGGWISFGGAMVLLALLSHWLDNRIVRRKLFALVAGMVVVIAAYTANHVFEFDVFDRESRELDAEELNRAVERFPLMNMASSGSHRLRIYRDGWELIQEKPWLGHGFMTFGDHYPRVQSADYEHTVIFAHNDYLQFWAEMGLVGLTLLLALIAAVYWQAWRAWQVISEDQKPVLMGLVVALSAYFAHALVDFVFYVPALFLMAACYMGYVNHLSREQCTVAVLHPGRWLSPRMRIFAKAVAFIVPAWLLFEPALAQVVAHAGDRLEREGRTEQALSLYGLAQSLAPNESEYYRREAEYWLKEADQAPVSERLANALELYRQSAERNPFDLQSRFDLAFYNVRFRDRLADPAGSEQIGQWLEYVMERRPWDEDLARRAGDLLVELEARTGSPTPAGNAGEKNAEN